MDRRIFAVLGLTAVSALSACGGGGGSSSSVPAGGPAPTPAPKSVSGDMLGLAPSRGWNYQATYNNTSLTVSLYDDPTTSNGESALWAIGATGLVPTALTSASYAAADELAALAVSSSASGYNAVAENSYGGPALIPGSPLFVGSTLTQGATSTPYAGITETVVSVGAVPNANVCPTPSTGATVTYVYSGSTYTVSFVPGCGMTQIVAPTGATFNLVSVGPYPSIGTLAATRRLESVNLGDTARTILGLNHGSLPATHIFPPGLF